MWITNSIEFHTRSLWWTEVVTVPCVLWTQHLNSYTEAICTQKLTPVRCGGHRSSQSLVSWGHQFVVMDRGRHRPLCLEDTSSFWWTEVSHWKPIEFHTENQGTSTLKTNERSYYKKIMRTASVYSISDLRLSENPRPRCKLKDIDFNMTLKYSNWDRGQTSL